MPVFVVIRHFAAVSGFWRKTVKVDYDRSEQSLQGFLAEMRELSRLALSFSNTERINHVRQSSREGISLRHL